MKNIICLDGYTLNPGDNPWDCVAELGNFTCYDRSIESEEQVIERAKPAHILLTNKTVLSKKIIDACPNLEYIGLLSTGYNIVDYQYAKEKGIPVTNVPVYGTDTVAEMAIALMLGLARRVELNSNDATKNQGWAKSIDFCYWLNSQVELSGKTLGIIGFGNIGRRLGEIANVFKMNVIAHSRSQNNKPNYPHEFVELDDLLKRSDFVSLNCPVFPETENLMNKERLALMKDSAFLINTARGQLIVEQDLADALNNGTIAGAGLDVLQQEPPKKNNPLLTAKNCIITPHIAWATLDARSRITKTVSENIQAYLSNKPTNVINK